TIFPTEIATKLINIGNKPRLIVYIRDITERKRAEKKRKSLLKKEREQHLKAETLAKVALILTSKLSLSDVLEEVFRQVKRLVPYSACNVSLIEKGGLYNVHSVGYNKYGSKKFVNNFTYPVDKLSLYKEVIKLAKPLLITDTYKDTRWIIFKETSWIRSFLSIPVCLGNKVVGLLNLDGDTPGKFVKNDIKKLQPLVNAAAIALENARLFEEVQKEITERKQAEKTLVESEEKYRTIFENTGTAVIIIEEDKTISMANAQSEKLSGYSKEEIENKMKWTDFVILEDLKMMDEYHTARRKVGEKPPTEYEFRLIDKKGNMKNIFLKIGIIPSTKKSIASLIDISERKQAEEALCASEERYFTLFNNANDLIQIANPAGKILAVNKKWLATLEYSQEDAKGLRVTDIIREDKIPQISRLLQEVARGRSISFETVFISKSGKEINVEGRGNGIFKDGKFVSAVGIFRDITESKHSEENLKNAKDELQIILDSVPAIIFYKDVEGRIIRANKILADSLKMPVKDLVGKTTEELFPEEQAENMRKDDKEVIISGKAKRNIVEPYTTPDGTRWLITDKVPYKDKEGKITGVISLSKDITVQKKSEEELQQSYQKLKKTMDAALDTMSKIIEVKDPYTSGHQHRVYQLAIRIAQEMELPEDKIEGIRIASLIHDIGKIGLPTEILSKPTKLTDIEFSLIKGHSQIGYDILKSIDFSYPIAQIVLQHHERLNGSGYPNGLRADKILLEAKIIGVVDVVEAMSSFRPYRPALGIDAALEEISQNKGIFYDPGVVDVCLKLFKEKEFKFE
ncbi:MAG: PAS domain S-box protein, partial [Candidatus Atribacteria bacterium]|nr:PAS domain S-box protein [Candidatus Atribacteria bacterium]